MLNKIVIIAVIVVVINLHLVECYTPVMIVPGIGPPFFCQEYVNQIKQKYHGTDVVMASCDPTGIQSVLPLRKQVKATYECKKVKDFIARNPDGFHVIGVSLGTIVARALIQEYGLPVNKFISVAGVHMGASTVPIVYLIPFLKPGTTLGDTLNSALAHLTCHVPCTLSFLSDVAKNPCKMDIYKKCNKFLPYFNNEIEHNNSKKYKENFLRIKKVYLLANVNDNSINPWQSGHFGYVNCHRDVIAMKDQEVYKKNTFGLRTLDEKGAIKLINVSETVHWKISGASYVKKYVIPILNEN